MAASRHGLKVAQRRISCRRTKLLWRKRYGAGSEGPRTSSHRGGRMAADATLGGGTMFLNTRAFRAAHQSSGDIAPPVAMNAAICSARLYSTCTTQRCGGTALRAVRTLSVLAWTNGTFDIGQMVSLVGRRTDAARRCGQVTYRSSGSIVWIAFISHIVRCGAVALFRQRRARALPRHTLCTRAGARCTQRLAAVGGTSHNIKRTNSCWAA